jgi:hypothetical protein
MSPNSPRPSSAQASPVLIHFDRRLRTTALVAISLFGTAAGELILIVAEKLQALYFTFAAEISRNLPVWKHLTHSSIQHVFGHIGFA